MQGKIKFYNEDKGFGYLIGDDKKDYFFHISNINNKPEKIDKNDFVSFDPSRNDKGLEAKDITILRTIKCPVCGWNNSEEDEKCTNKKCGFTLEYVRGFHSNISDEELQQYQDELKNAKENFQSKNNKKENTSKKSSQGKGNSSKIIKGKIIFFHEENGYGFIRGEDGQKYYFHISNVDKPLEIIKGVFVFFIPQETNKGLGSSSIVIDTNSNSTQNPTQITNNYYNDEDDDDDYYEDDEPCEDCGYYECNCFEECNGCGNSNYSCTCNDDYDNYDDYYDDDNDDEEPCEENGWGITQQEFATRYYYSDCPKCGGKLFYYSNGYVKCDNSWCDWWNYLVD